MAIQDLTASLDLKQNLNIYITCKQFDNLNLILNIFDNSVQANLTGYNVRLKAMKSDQVPLIQEHTGININSNIVNIEADEQLTTTAGDTPIELQFIDSTGNKKATFNLVLKVVPGVIAVSASISTATYTLLEELENKLDQATDYFENLTEFIEQHPDIPALDTRVTNVENEIESARDGNDTLNDRFENINESILNVSKNRELKNKLYKKSIFKQLPLLFPDYQAIVNQESITYLYPQSFTIDWDNNEIFILYSPDGGTSTKRWIVVYALDTLQYKVCFNAGNSGGEGIVVKKEGVNRFLYVKETEGILGKYLINVLPTNLSILTATAIYNVGLYYNFSYRNGTWIVEQKGAALGVTERRTVFSFYNDDFQLIGSINVGIGEGGPWNDDVYYNYLPKRQGIALANGVVLQATGGIYNKGDALTPYSYTGIKILNTKGEMEMEGIIDPSLMIAELEKNSIVCSRIEIEGVHFSPSGEVYSIVVHQDRFMTEATQTGIIIFKEFSDEDNAFDFSNIGKVYAGFNPTILETGVFPRSGDGNMYNPLNGQKLDTFEKILSFMSSTDLKRFSFYSSATNVADINGNAVPSASLVVIYNANNATFFIEYISESSGKKFIVYGASGSRTQKQIYQNHTVKTLALENGTTAFDAARTPKVIIKSDGSRQLTGLTNNTPQNGTTSLATLAAEDCPIKNLNFIVGTTSSTAGGYAAITINTSGKVIVTYVSNASQIVSLEGVTWFTDC